MSFLDCKELEKLIDLKNQTEPEEEPCCFDGECCKGMGECDEECCDEDGNKEMGNCNCAEDNEDYKHPTEEEIQKHEQTKKDLEKHFEICSVCSKERKKYLESKEERPVKCIQ